MDIYKCLLLINNIYRCCCIVCPYERLIDQLGNMLLHFKHIWKCFCNRLGRQWEPCNELKETLL